MFSTRTIFLIDGIGALLTASSLLFVPSLFPDLFGLPRNTTCLLGGIAVVLASYSLVTYAFFQPSYGKILLRGIALGNAAYCILTAWLLSPFLKELTVFGWLYFSAEVSIILFLVGWEWKTSDRC
ncbi:MAG: hypothetical protein A1D16_04940 [Flavihumibacter sp. CACIAM 22H1]|nr:MAG: hypothetical protein A1D16_04940 [Flavihumibacter sp. CACIAM 22H1]